LQVALVVAIQMNPKGFAGRLVAMQQRAGILALLPAQGPKRGFSLACNRDLIDSTFAALIY